MELDTQQQLLIEQRVANDGKSALVAYLLLIFLGVFGAHRFYLGKTGSGILMLVMWLLGWATVVIFIGLIPLVIVGIWVLVDVFLIPGMITESTKRMRNDLRQELSVMAGAKAASVTTTPQPI